MTEAMALNSLRSNISAIAGTAIAGVLISLLGLPIAYTIDVVTFAVSALLIFLVRPQPVAEHTSPPSWRSMAEGVRYALSRPLLVGSYLVDLVATALALPFALFAFLAADLGAPWTLGLMFSATAAGGMIATATRGRVVGRDDGRGRAQPVVVADAGDAHARRRHQLRRRPLPRHHVEPRCAGPAARAPCRYRAAGRLGRAAAG
jgi:hypothetical protein